MAFWCVCEMTHSALLSMYLMDIKVIFSATPFIAAVNNNNNKNWSHLNSSEKFKERFGSYTRKTFSRFTTKDSYTGNITHNTQSTTLCNLKPEWWGSQLVQEKYQEEKVCDKRR